MHLNKGSLLVCLSMMLYTAHVNAVSILSDRALFLASLSNPTVIDFEDITVAPTETLPVIGDPWIEDGIVFDEAGVGDNMAIGGGNGDNKNIFALGGEEADISITLLNPTQAFGLEIFSNNIHSTTERLIFFDVTNTVIADLEMPATGFSTESFIGIISDTPEIKHILFADDDDGDYVGIGEVIFTAVVPIPSTVWLFGSGLLILAVRIK